MFCTLSTIAEAHQVARLLRRSFHKQHCNITNHRHRPSAPNQTNKLHKCIRATSNRILIISNINNSNTISCRLHRRRLLVRLVAHRRHTRLCDATSASTRPWPLQPHSQQREDENERRWHRPCRRFQSRNRSGLQSRREEVRSEFKPYARILFRYPTWNLPKTNQNLMSSKLIAYRSRRIQFHSPYALLRHGDCSLVAFPHPTQSMS